MKAHLSKALERLTTAMSELDPSVTVLLRGHLIIEEALTGILELHVFHPEHLDSARLTFHMTRNTVRATSLVQERRYPTFASTSGALPPG